MAEWLEHLPEELRSDTDLQKFENVEGLARSYMELGRWKGNAIRIPGSDAGPDARKEFTGKLIDRVPELMYKPDNTSPEQMGLHYETLGVPKESSGYETPDGIELEEVTVNKTREMAHHAHLSPAQHKAVIGWLSTENAEVAAEIERAQQADTEALTSRWGDTTEQRKQRVDTFLSEVQSGEGEPEIGELNAAGYLKLDRVIEMFNGKGPQVNAQPSAELHATLDEIEENISEIQTRRMTEGRQMDGATQKQLSARLNTLLQQKQALMGT